MFPAPIGGIPLPSEFAGSLIFAILYGLLIPVLVYRLWDRRSRTIVFFGTILAVFERTIVLSLRTVATQRDDWRFSDGFLKYNQITLGLGFVSIGNDLVGLVRCLLVNPTYGYGDGGRYDESPAAATKDSSFQAPRVGDVDRPAERQRCRQFSFWMLMFFLSSNIPGSVAGGMFQRKYFENEQKAHLMMNLRYASSAVALFLISVLMAAAAWSRKYQPRASHKAIHRLFVLGTLLIIVALYRLSVMHHTTPAFESTLAGTLNSPGAKASFYILHLLPEWLCLVILMCFNTRKTFGTGPVGDRRGRDDTPEQILKRKAQKAKRDAKKANRENRNADPERHSDSIPLRNIATSSLLIDTRLTGSGSR